ncbi:hypothetical protein [Flavobacterium hiemivividum]|uniref:hypothetical protein n=1 Tax=Flavobacterium hiemivividum TaxID=2541734 RepID=UPI0014048EB5|nr:hypothetical protein [Flavobacterium hiemivividum]
MWENPLLEFHSKYEKRYNDVVYEIITRKYKNLFFSKHQSRLEISGSIHYFFNDGLHNANDFYVEDCIETIYCIQNLFNLDLEKCFLVNLEYGVNILPSIPISKLILNLIYHERHPFIRSTEHNEYRISRNSKYKQVKAYAKGVQFPQFCNPNTFRFEVKTGQAKFIKKLGILTLKGLTNPDNYNALLISLLKEWNNVLLFDKSRCTDDKFLSTHFWEETILAKNRNKFCLQKKLYYKKLGADNLHTSIRNIIERKTKYLKSVHIPTIIEVETAQVKILF